MTVTTGEPSPARTRTRRRPLFPGGGNALSASRLAQVVRSFAADIDGWSEIVRYDPTQRWWHLMHADEQMSVWLLSWLPGQGTDLHDHGASRAHFGVVSGQLHEWRASRAGSLRGRQLSVGGSRAVPVRAVHQVINQSAAPAVSIHAYSPPLERMAQYTRDQSGLRVSSVEHWAGAARDRTALGATQ